MTLDEKIEEIEKAIERLEKTAEKDHSERMYAAIDEAVREERQTLKWLKDYKRLLESLENQKTGHWYEIEHSSADFPIYICSECNCGSGISKDFKYCPNCGAKMEGE